MTDTNAAHLNMEQYAELGLIDRLLMLRNDALTPELLASVTRETRVWKAHQSAVDAALALIVPGLQAIVALESPKEHGLHCIFKPEVENILGKVPVQDWRARRAAGLL